MSSFKSIHNKEKAIYYVVSANKVCNLRGETMLLTDARLTWRQSNVSTTNEDVYLPVMSL